MRAKLSSRPNISIIPKADGELILPESAALSGIPILPRPISCLSANSRANASKYSDVHVASDSNGVNCFSIPMDTEFRLIKDFSSKSIGSAVRIK